MGNGYNEVISPASNYSDPGAAFRESMGRDRNIKVKTVEVSYHHNLGLAPVNILMSICPSPFLIRLCLGIIVKLTIVTACLSHEF